MLAGIAQAIVLFIATNIDDVIILSLFFARGAGAAGTTARIMVGQYIGFIAILVFSILSAWGAGFLLPESAISYLGLIPLALGIKAAWEAFRGEDEDELDATKRLSLWSVAAVTFANGGDNLAIYVPVFVNISWQSVIIYSVIFLILLAGLVYLSRWVASRPGIDEILERSERILFPVVMIVLGIIILLS